MDIWSNPAEDGAKEVEELVELVVAVDVVVHGDVTLGSDAEEILEWWWGGDHS